MSNAKSAMIVCRLVGVPDCDPRHLWEIWSGAPGESHDLRRRVLLAARADPDGERAIANLVTYGVLAGISRVAMVGETAVVQAFKNATLEQLTWLADRPEELPNFLGGQSK